MTLAKNTNVAFTTGGAGDTHNRLKERWKGEEAAAASSKNAGLKALEKSGRASAIIGHMAKGDDKLTRKAEEQAIKVNNIIFKWLF